MARNRLFPSRWLVLALTASLASSAGAANPGNGNGNKPPPSEEVGNSLSYPTMFYGTPLQTGTIGAYSLTATFPNGLSYGCAKPEIIGTTTYPNTSCVDDSAPVVTPISPEACVAEGGKCEGFEYVTGDDDPTIPNLERIYWQKNVNNAWQAHYATAVTNETPPAPLALVVDYVDWGDNLESRSWPAQIIRVETNTFQALQTSVLRFEVWHVFGQGTNELWGVHATNAATPLPYVYDTWPFAVNVAPQVRLNLTKLVNGPANCPTEPGAAEPIVRTWSPTTHWGGFELYDGAYTAELNIKGSYVYGYNWNLRSAVVPPEVNKAGWWRLTFYTANDSVDFSQWVDPATAGVNTLAPPGAALEPRPVGVTVAAEETESGPLYVPVVDQVNNVTYLDICILSTKGGGSKKQ